MYYIVVHIIDETAHVVFQTTVKFQLIVDCGAIYFIFQNSSFQGIVSTYIHKSSSKYVDALVHMCVRTRDFSYKSIPLFVR